ncbi:hypothetical protein DRN74_02990 [Candidatus Micrarchaeota archaeon]|nr:MAG: hypothetical protein DRN74_02990 [Candidatus Micrarchaeota archaeon]
MVVRVSQMYGLEIYDTDGSYIGKAYDLILNLEKGEVVRITTEPLGKIKSPEKIEEIIKRKSILFSRVRNIKDIIVVNK